MEQGTQFTSDAATIAPVLERFRQHHAAIEQALLLYFSGLRARLDGLTRSSSPIPASIQADIDAVFGPRPLSTPTTTEDEASLARSRAARSILQALDETELNDPERTRLTSLGAATGTGGWSGASLYDFAEVNTRGMQDLIGLYGAITYLSFVEGEKHLIFVTEQGFYNPSADNDHNLATRAAAARVAISIVHTGGTNLGPPPNTFIPTASGTRSNEASVGDLNVSRAPAPPASPSFVPTAADWRLASSKILADQTGGFFTSTSRAGSFFDRVNRLSDNLYQIGFTPAIPPATGDIRRITVEVTRRNVDVRHRHAYSETPMATPTRREVYAALRLGSASTSTAHLTELPVAVTVASSTATEVALEITVGPRGLTLTPAADGNVRVELDLAVYCTTESGELIGQRMQKLDLQLTAAEVASVATQGLRIRTSVAVKGRARHIRTVLYDWRADTTGASTVSR